MVNSHLRKQILRMQPLLPYDYHSALIAAALGQRRFIDQALLLYRQHSHNVISAGRAGKSSLTSKVAQTLQLAIDAFPNIQETVCFFGAELSPEVRIELDDFTQVLFGKNTLKRLVIALRRPYTFYRRRDSLNLLLHICKMRNI